MLCKYILKVPFMLLFQHLKLQFVDFDIEYHYSCVWDFLEISQHNKTIRRSCGTALPVMISSNSSYLKLVFHSDIVVPKKGFKVRVFTESKFKLLSV